MRATALNQREVEAHGNAEVVAGVGKQTPARDCWCRVERFTARRRHCPDGWAVVEEVEHKIDMFVDNAQRRADKPSEARRHELTELGIRRA